MKKLIVLLLLSITAVAQSVYTPTEWKALGSKTVQPRYIASVPASSYKQAPDYLFNGSYGTALIANYQTRGEAVLYIKTTSAFTITLSNVPDFVVGKRIIIKDESGGTPNVTVQSHAPGSIPIDGLTSVNLTKAGGEWVVYCTGSAWTINQTNLIAASPPSGTYKWMRQDDCNNVSWQPLPTTAIGTLEGEVLLIKNGLVKPYDSIYEANDSAATGATIVMLKDITLTTPLVLKSGTSIDGAGKSLTMPISGNGIEISAGTTTIMNVKAITGTAGTDAQNSTAWIYAHDAVLYLFVNEVITGKSPFMNLGGAAKAYVQIDKFNAGTYNNYNTYTWRKFFVSAGSFLKVSNTEITDDLTSGTGNYGAIGSVVHSSGASFADRSVMIFENCNLKVSGLPFIVERGGEFNCTNVKAITSLDRGVFGSHYGEAGQPYGVIIFKDSKIITGSTKSYSGADYQALHTIGGIWYCEFHGTNQFIDGGASAYALVDGSGLGTYDWKNYGKLYINKAPNISLFDATYNNYTLYPEITSAGGSVTSVGVSVPSGLGVTGSPVTSSGTIAITTSLSGLLKGTGSGFTAATPGTDYVAGNIGTANYIPKFTALGVIGNSIIQDNGSKVTIGGGADAFLVTSNGSGVTGQLEQTSNNDVLYRFKRNGGGFWDARYYYSGQSFKFNYNDSPVFTLNTDGTASLAGALSLGSALGLSYGGTGQTTRQASLNALTGTQTSGYYLKSDGTNSALSALSASDLTGTLGVANGGTGATSFTAGRILFGNGTSAVNTSSNLFWDNTNGRLGINNASPSYGLDVTGTGRFTSNLNIDATTNATAYNSAAVVSAGGIGYYGSIRSRMKATNDRVFTYEKPDGSNLFYSQFDGSNFHHYLGATQWYNLGSNSMYFSGTGVVGISNGAVLNIDPPISGATAGIQFGNSNYATAGTQLTSSRPYYVNTWAWNGTNGYSVQSQTYQVQTQLSTTNQDARVDFYNGSAQSIYSIKTLTKQFSIGTQTPNASSILEVASTTLGAIPTPKMTTTQRDAIASPTEGLQIFNTTTHTPNYYDGSTWTGIGSSFSVALSAPSIFTVTGSPVTSTGTISLTLASQSANSIFAAPTSTSGVPAFRSMVKEDLPISGVVAGPYGNASNVGQFTVDAYGRITSAANIPITASTTVSLYVRPETHGAVGNGSTDDATAFQTAINTCTSGCTILLSSGKNYRINTMLTPLSNITFMTDGGNAIITSGISGVAHTFYVNNVDNVHFIGINFTLSGSPSNTNVAGHILFNRSKNSSVRNCTFTKSHWFDIQVKGEAAENSENIIIDGNKSLQLAAEGGSGNSPCSITVWGYARNITITNNQSLGVGAMGIAIQNFGGTGTINYVYVSGNAIRDKDTYGIMAYDANADRSVVNIQIVNNHVENVNGVNGVTGNAGAGIYLASCFDCTVIGNYVKNSNFGTTGNSLAPGGIGLNDADNCIVSDNKIVECDYHAITVRNTDGFTLTGNNIMAPRYMAIEVWQSSNGTITGNRMSSATNTEQMYYLKGSSDIVFSGNIVNCTGNYRVVDLDGSGANYRCVISNNNFNYTGTSNVLMLGSSGTNDYFVVKGNVFRNNTSNATKRGFSITSMTNCNIEGNSFLCASGQDAVLTSGTCTGTTYSNNTILGNMNVDTGTTGLQFKFYASAAPSASGYATGSIVYNSAASGAGSAYGWMKTSGGTWRTISTL